MNAAGRGHSKEAAAPGGLAPHTSAYDKKCIRQGERQLSEAASYPRGTAEITTKAWAIGPSSVMVRSMRGSQPAGVIALRRASAPPVSFMVGRPDGRLTTPMSRQNTPRTQTGTERLGAGLLGGETLGVGFDPPGAAFGLCALERREDAIEEALTMPFDRALDAADIDEIGTDSEDHARPRSIAARMVFTASARPEKTPSPIRK